MGSLRRPAFQWVHLKVAVNAEGSPAPVCYLRVLVFDCIRVGQCTEKKNIFVGQSFWASRLFRLPVGRDEAVIRWMALLARHEAAPPATPRISVGSRSISARSPVADKPPSIRLSSCAGRLKAATGAHAENPTLDRPCRVAFAAGRRRDRSDRAACLKTKLRRFRPISGGLCAPRHGPGKLMWSEARGPA